MADFDSYAGQLVQNGTFPNAPVLTFEDTATKTKLANIANVDGMMPKIADVLVHETRIQDGSLDKYFTRRDLPYGAGIEQIAFTDGAANKRQGNVCFPYGQVEAAGQLDLINFASNYPITIYDHEIRQNVLNENQLGSFVTQKLRTPYKGYAAQLRKSQIQLVSDVIDGTRSISSTENSDGTGSSVTYAPTITGYAGRIVDSQIVLPALVAGTIPAFASAGDATTLCKLLEDEAASMKEESTTYSKLGINTFILDQPLLVMETRTLNALDNALAMDGADKRVPTRTAREFFGTFAEVVEIPAFADLPTNATYADKRLGAVLLDRDSCGMWIQQNDVETMRCPEQRATGYSWQTRSLLSIFRGNPACGILFDTA